MVISKYLLKTNSSHCEGWFISSTTSSHRHKCMWIFVVFSFLLVSHFKSCLELTIGFMGVYQITQRTIAFWKAWPGIQWRAFVQPRLYGASFCSIYLINRKFFRTFNMPILQFYNINSINAYNYHGIFYIWFVLHTK